MKHLEIAADTLATLRVPAMRKDFLVDPYQLLEARVAGASGVLIILRMLSRAEIEALLDGARTLGLFVLLEAFDEQDIEAMHDLFAGQEGQRPADAAAPVLVGLNCRDLTTLQIVPERLVELAHLLPSNMPRVAESGVSSPEDAARMAAAGYEYVLVGSALMKGGNPEALASAMLAAGRSATHNL
jgi:indole-3-glycerol phosphate synthase